MAVLVPHFDLPFRLSGTSFAVAEQDSFGDIANCVEAIVRTPNGVRDDTPEFGLDDHTFDNRPLNIEQMTAQIENQEPRASVVLTEQSNFLDDLIAEVRIVVNP